MAKRRKKSVIATRKQTTRAAKRITSALKGWRTRRRKAREKQRRAKEKESKRRIGTLAEYEELFENDWPEEEAESSPDYGEDELA